jgi:hypothetical protein
MTGRRTARTCISRSGSATLLSIRRRCCFFFYRTPGAAQEANLKFEDDQRFFESIVEKLEAAELPRGRAALVEKGIGL